MSGLAEYGDEIDVIAPADILKQIFKIPYSKAQVSIAVNRIGDTLILNTGYVAGCIISIILNIVNTNAMLNRVVGLMSMKAKRYSEDKVTSLKDLIHQYF